MTAIGLLVMRRLNPPVGPKPLRCGEGPRIHVLLYRANETWMAGSSPAMTMRNSTTDPANQPSAITLP
jgi:hypothetical protein